MQLNKGQMENACQGCYRKLGLYFWRNYLALLRKEPVPFWIVALSFCSLGLSANQLVIVFFRTKSAPATNQSALFFYNRSPPATDHNQNRKKVTVNKRSYRSITAANRGEHRAVTIRVNLTDRSGQTGAVRYRYTVYRSGLAGNRSVPVEFKFRSSTGSYRYTGRFDW